MNNPVVMIGIGEIGGVLARGCLRRGYPLYPVTRRIPMAEVAEQVPDPEAVVVAVGEKDLAAVLASLPEGWKDRLVLLQNELLPKAWQDHGIINPTVISIWFEKKPGRDVKVIIPSPIYGPKARWLREVLAAVSVPGVVLENEEELLFELVLKNVYILTTNIAGLVTGATVRDLWERHQDLALRVARDVMDIQFALIKKDLDRDRLLQGMRAAFAGDWDHQCQGRSAPARLQRALRQAEDLGVVVETLRSIQADSARAGT